MAGRKPAGTKRRNYYLKIETIEKIAYGKSILKKRPGEIIDIVFAAVKLPTKEAMQNAVDIKCAIARLAREGKIKFSDLKNKT